MIFVHPTTVDLIAQVLGSERTDITLQRLSDHQIPRVRHQWKFRIQIDDQVVEVHEVNSVSLWLVAVMGTA